MLAKAFSLLESFLNRGFLRVNFLNEWKKYVQSLPFEAIDGKIGILKERIYKISNSLSIEDRNSDLVLNDKGFIARNVPEKVDSFLTI